MVLLAKMRRPSGNCASACTVIAPVLVGDRKSTRLNSSHLVISYAVFCLKKKKKKIACQNESGQTNRVCLDAQSEHAIAGSDSVADFLTDCQGPSLLYKSVVRLSLHAALF